MEPADWPDTGPDIGNAPCISNVFEAPALLRITGYENYLVDYTGQGIDQPFNKCLPLEGEEIFLLPVCPAGFATDKDDCRSQCPPPSTAIDFRNSMIIMILLL
jgi:hypothetical protein